MISCRIKYLASCFLGVISFLLFCKSSCGQTNAAKHKDLPSYHIPTSEEKKKEFKKSMIAPAALFVAGGIAFTDNDFWSDDAWADGRNRYFSDFRVRVDDYLAFAPVATVYGLQLAGIKGKHTLYDQTAILLKAELIAFTVVGSLKGITMRERPDMANNQSFPSGHTAQAFIGATFLHREYGHLSPWYSIGGYTAATAVGAMRIMNNKHYLSDVLFGAGIGILVTNLSYLTHGYKRTKRRQGLTVLPTYNQGTLGFSAGLRF